MGGFEKGGQNFKIAMLLIGNPHKAQRKTCCRLGLSVDRHKPCILGSLLGIISRHHCTSFGPLPSLVAQ